MLATIAAELTIAQKNTFANKSVDAFTGNILDFKAVKPSRVIFVAQKVFVKMLKINNTKSAKVVTFGYRASRKTLKINVTSLSHPLLDCIFEHAL